MRSVIVAAAIVASAGVGAGVAAVAVHETDGGTAVTTTVQSPAVTVGASPAASTTSTGGLSVGEIYRRSVDGVVEVLSTGTSSGSGFFGGSQTESAQGTGFEIDRNGNIVTNYHVVAGASSIRVRLNDGHVYTAKLVGSDPTTDVAVLHADLSSSELHPLPFADSSSVRVGDSVVAIGDPYGLQDTTTAGIVSAVGRTITSPNNRQINGTIQTDAAINSGNSGGPLLNASAQVIGVNSQIESGSQGGTGSGGNIGIGFAIPSNLVASIAHELITTGKAPHPYVGVELVTVSPSIAKATGMTAGVEVVSVVKNSPGKAAGLAGATGSTTVGGVGFRTGGDVITAIDGHSVRTADQLIAQISAKKPGDTIKLTVVRNGSTSTISVTLGSQP